MRGERTRARFGIGEVEGGGPAGPAVPQGPEALEPTRGLRPGEPPVVGLEPGEFVHTFGDTHLYMNHIEQARLQLTREPYEGPRMVLNPDKTDLFDWTYEDFSLQDYQAHPHIKAPVAV